MLRGNSGKGRFKPRILDQVKGTVLETQDVREGVPDSKGCTCSKTPDPGMFKVGIWVVGFPSTPTQPVGASPARPSFPRPLLLRVTSLSPRTCSTLALRESQDAPAAPGLTVGGVVKSDLSNKLRGKVFQPVIICFRV